MKWILSAMILMGGTFLVCETMSFCQMQGLNLFLSFIVALTLESFCIIAAMYRKRVLVGAFIALVLCVSSYNRVAPILKADGLSAIQAMKINALAESVKDYQEQIKTFKEQGQPKNTARVSRLLTSAKEKHIAAIEASEASPASVVSWVTMSADIIGIIFLRLFVQLSNIFCAERLGAPLLKKKKRPPLHPVLAKFLGYMNEKDGAIVHQKLLESKVITAADAVDLTSDLLKAMGRIDIEDNGKKANRQYLIA